MPKIIRVQLTDEQRVELNRRSRERVLAPRQRERLEMIRLSDLGYRIPQIAKIMGRHEQSVRRWLQAFLDQGFDGLADAPIPGRAEQVTEAALLALEQMLDEAAASGRSWTLAGLVGWLREQQGIEISPSQLSKRLKARGFIWKRMYRSLRHKQKDPDLQAAKEAELEALNL